MPLLTAGATLLALAYWAAVWRGVGGGGGGVPQWAMRAWNGGLALFSVAGAAHLGPLLLRQLRQRHPVEVLCDASYWIDDPWACWFVASKVVEFGDTLLLRRRGRPVTFLHAYHHGSVLVYSAHALAVRNPVGIWFMALNLLVHAVMYAYYVAPQRWAAPLITLPFVRTPPRKKLADSSSSSSSPKSPLGSLEYIS